MTMNQTVSIALETDGPGLAQATTKRHAISVAWHVAKAVETGMDGWELVGYIEGLADMAGEAASARAADYYKAVLDWDEAMAKAGKELPFNEKLDYKR